MTRRTVEDILAHADELAKQFEDFEPDPDKDPIIIDAHLEALPPTEPE